MIGFIDSGVGCLNVFVECYKIINEDYVCLCDNKYAPYGNKSKAKLLKITRRNIDYLIEHYRVTTVVLACNTLSNVVYEEIKKEYKNIKIIKIEFNLININKLKKEVLFLGTKNTIKNNKIIKNKIKQKGYKALYIRNLAKYIDNNLNNINNLNKLINKYLNNNKYNNINSVVLCCTHFKLIKDLIKNNLKNDVYFYEYEKDFANNLKSIIPSKITKSFHIVLTNYNYARYVELKAYVYKCLRE